MVAFEARMALALALAGQSGCASEQASSPPLPEPLWRGEHLRFRTNAAEPLCGGTLAYMDGLVPLLATALEVPIPDLVDFYWHPAPLGGTSCPAQAAGCWDGKMVWSRLVPHDHEIVHAITSSLGKTDRMVEEGIAVVYGDDGAIVEWYEVPMHEPETLIALDDASVGADVYTSAAHLTRFMLDRHPMDSLHAFWRSTPRSATRDEFTSSFALSFGETWDDFAAAYRDYPSCIRGAIRMKVSECPAPSVPWDGDTWHTALDLSCEAVDIVGPTQGLMWKTVTLDIPRGGRYLLEVVGAGDAAVALARCDAGCDGGFAENLYSGQARVRELLAGHYYAKFWRWVDEPGPLELFISPEM